jgi:hypothetical protein
MRSRFALLSLVAALVVITWRDGEPVYAQPKAAPITVPPQAPTLNVPFPLGAQRGQTLDLTLTGTNLADPVALWTSFPAKATFPTDMNNGKDAAKLRVKLEVPADAPIGFHTIRLATKHGLSNTRMFCVDELPQLDEAADNTAKEKAQGLPVPCVVVGKTTAEVSDFYKVSVKPGQRLTFEVIGRRLGSQLDPIVRLYDAKTGRDLPGHYSDDEPGLQSDARLTQTFKAGGDYLVEVRDTRHLGGTDYHYRLRIAECPNAMTAYPVAVKKGTKASVGFTGKAVDGVPPVEVAMPADRAAVNIVPRAQGGSGGWPVPVAASDVDELVEQEPNNDPAKGQKITVPCGITARFLEKGDLDCFTFAAKKGTKFALIGETYGINSPAEVYLIVKDAKGGELAKSTPQNTPARIDFTAPADGDFTVVAEHLNYLHGPTEVYHLSVQEAGPDFNVQLQLDRLAVAPGGMTLVPVAPPTRREYTGPIELTVIGHPGLTGSVVVPNAPPPPPNAPAPPIAFLPLTCKADVPPGAYDVRVLAKATINGKEVSKLVTVSDLVRTGLNGLPFPPREMLTSVGVAVTGPPLFSLTVKFPGPDVTRGVATNVTVSAKRADGFADEIQLVPVNLPPNVTLAVKPIPKGANEITFPLTVAAAVNPGPLTITLRATAKPGGKDFAYYSNPTTVTVVAAPDPKKADPKKMETKVEPKKVEAKKVEPKKESPITVKAEPSPLMLKIGQKAKLKVTVARKGDFKGPVDVEVKNLPANVTAAKATIPADKTEVEVELTAAANAAAGDKPDVQVLATAAGQAVSPPPVVLKVVK